MALRVIPFFVLLFIFCLTALVSLRAQTLADVSILPHDKASETGIYIDDNLATHPPLKLTPDKSEILRLDAEIGTVIVGNPAHLSVMAESANTLILVSRQPGATFMSALDKEGNVIMQRHVLIAAPQKNYVRVRRTCGADATNCAPTSVYYCPDTCYNVAVQSGDEASSSGASGSDSSGTGTSEEEITADAENLDNETSDATETVSGTTTQE